MKRSYYFLFSLILILSLSLPCTVNAKPTKKADWTNKLQPNKPVTQQEAFEKIFEKIDYIDLDYDDKHLANFKNPKKPLTRAYLSQLLFNHLERDSLLTSLLINKNPKKPLTRFELNMLLSDIEQLEEQHINLEGEITHIDSTNLTITVDSKKLNLEGIPIFYHDEKVLFSSLNLEDRILAFFINNKLEKIIIIEKVEQNIALTGKLASSGLLDENTKIIFETSDGIYRYLDVSLELEISFQSILLNSTLLKKEQNIKIHISNNEVVKIEILDDTITGEITVLKPDYLRLNNSSPIYFADQYQIIIPNHSWRLNEKDSVKITVKDDAKISIIELIKNK